MQTANEKTVLGDFNKAELVHHGQVTRFFRRDGKFLVRTAGTDGKLRDFPVVYTFGVYPLQQYLISLPRGRLQAFGIAWDARPRKQGGQRWYHLYPDSPPQPGESIHWSGRDQNWNFMCAACHSTRVRKNYDLATDSYKTAWAEINVGCEACHGPGSGHLAWTRGKRTQSPPGLGLDPASAAPSRMNFGFSTAGQTIARPRDEPDRVRTSNETCPACHSRRQELIADPNRRPGAAFLDRYLPSLIEAGLYHADGQIDGEVFEAGSFAQSAMQRAGVVCSHCHESHSLKLRAVGNAVCAQCHLSAHYDRQEHHRHSPASTAAQCVSCHMPGKTYMGVHERRDHSLRIPRPDLSQRFGTPNACNGCHADKTTGWAATAVAQWTGKTPTENAGDGDRTAAAITAAWEGSADIKRLLAALASAPSAVAKASLLSLLPAGESPRKLEALALAATDADGLVRIGTARALSGVSSAEGLRIGVALLGDPLRAVRVEAARALAGTPATRLGEQSATRQRTATSELIQAELESAERPEAHVNLAALYINLGRPDRAEAELQTALRLEPNFVPALVDLADLYRLQRHDADAEPLLRRAVQQSPTLAEPAHALGLLLIRLGRRQEALPWLRKSVELAPTDARYAYVLGAAMSASNPGSALVPGFISK
jgi:tetratricopeptide (TPR) repeat protein